jgi:MFS transporter, PPP family, 3-phenylpropionic acid transporter
MLVTVAEKRSFATRLSAFYAALFVVLGGAMAYLPSWLVSKGFSASDIGWAAAVPMLLRLGITPAIAFFADRTGGHERATVGLVALGGLALLLIAGLPSSWVVLALVATFHLSMQAAMPMAETIAMRGVRYGGLDYGRMRLWGSLSFVVATYICGVLVERRGISVVIWFLIVGAGLTIAAAASLPARMQSEPMVGPMPKAAGADFVATLRLVLSPGLVVFLLASGAVQAGHALFYTFGVIHWRAVGLSSTWIGTLWAISIAVEVLLFSFSGAVIKWISPWNMVVAGAVASVIRWTAMAFDPSLPWLVLLQVLHAATFAGTHLGAMYFIRENVPEEQAGMVQALNVTLTSGLMMGLAQVLAGQTYDRFAGLSYLGMAAMGLLGLVICLFRRR